MQKMQNLEQVFHSLADAAADVIMPFFRAAITVDNKIAAAFDPVTEADRGAERAMRSILEAEFPDHGILGEEYGSARLESEQIWVLDPIDGTRSFISGIPLWGTLIGLQEKGRAVAGMMAQPFTRERYYGDEKGSVLITPEGRRPLKTRAIASLAEATVMTTSPRIFAPEKQGSYDRVEAACRLPRYGADCYAYALLAAGLVDVVVESGLHPYDIVALIPIIEGAGGIVTTWQGGRPEPGGDIVAVGNPALHGEVLKLLAG